MAAVLEDVGRVPLALVPGLATPVSAGPCGTVTGMWLGVVLTALVLLVLLVALVALAVSVVRRVRPRRPREA